jgi:predicted MFS family arabinose efflux permease
MPVGSLILLSLAVMVTVTAESLPAGLLPEMRTDLAVGQLQIGLLVSVWAVTVIVTSIPLARVTSRVDRRLVVGVALALFALANLATALSPSYAFVFGTRVAAAVAHGVFWAVIIVYGSSLLSPTQLGKGLAVITAGGTAATVVGLPTAVVLAQATGWRAAFVLLGLVAIVLAALILLRMPGAIPESVDRPRAKGHQISDPSLPTVATFGAAAILIALAQFTSFTYLRPFLTEAALVPVDASGAYLFLYGAAGMVGVLLAGLVADRSPRLARSSTLALFSVALGLLTIDARVPVVLVAALIVWGMAIGAVFPLMQTALMRTASDQVRPLASAGIIVVFNIGIAVGPWLGGVLRQGGAVTATTAVSTAAMLAATVIGTIAVIMAGRLPATSDAGQPTRRVSVGRRRF